MYPIKVSSSQRSNYQVLEIYMINMPHSQSKVNDYNSNLGFHVKLLMAFLTLHFGFLVLVRSTFYFRSILSLVSKSSKGIKGTERSNASMELSSAYHMHHGRTKVFYNL